MVLRKLAETCVISCVVLTKERQAFVGDPLRAKSLKRCRRDLIRMGKQIIRIWSPIDFDLTCEMRQRMSLDTYTANTKFLALNEGCARSTERIQHNALFWQLESKDILADEMRRKRQDEPIPIVGRSVVGLQRVGFTVGQRR